MYPQIYFPNRKVLPEIIKIIEIEIKIGSQQI